jgi:hypothetical protein
MENLDSLLLQRCNIERDLIFFLDGEPPPVIKKARSSSPKDKAANVGYVSHSARLDGRD